MNRLEKYTQQLQAEMLRDISPTLYSMCEKALKPILTDLEQVPEVFNFIQANKGRPDPENIVFFISVIMRLYTPTHLHLNSVKLQVGYREAFSKVFGFNNQESWNAYAEPVQSFMLNKRFAQEVNEYAGAIVEYLKINGKILENNPDLAPCPLPSKNVKYLVPVRHHVEIETLGRNLNKYHDL